MPHYMATLKLPTGFHNPHDKKVGVCTFSPMCTDSTGAHHTVVIDALGVDNIAEWAKREGMHLTRVEEIFFIKSLPGEYDVPVSGSESVDGRETDGGDTGGTAASSGAASRYDPKSGNFGYVPAGPITELPGDGIGSAYHAALEEYKERTGRRAAEGD